MIIVMIMIITSFTTPCIKIYYTDVEILMLIKDDCYEDDYDDDEVEEEDLLAGMKIWYGEWGCELCPTITAQEKPSSKPSCPLNHVQTRPD